MCYIMHTMRQGLLATVNTQLPLQLVMHDTMVYESREEQNKIMYYTVTKDHIATHAIKLYVLVS